VIVLLSSEHALRLSPFDPLAFEAHQALACAAFMEGRYEDAVSCFARAAQTNANFGMAYFMAAMALLLAGRGEEARRWVRQGLDLEPGFCVRNILELGARPHMKERFAEAARRLGLLE
jgi:adenylate cyclase